MEKYFIVTQESPLYHDYFAWKENRKKVYEHVKKFMTDYNITSQEYHASQNLFYIVPTQEDLDKFGKALGKDIGNGLRPFKRNSKIGKAWIKSLEDSKLKILPKPAPIFYFEGVCGRYRTRLFDIEGTVYCSIEPLYSEKIPVGMKEIKASEFYKILEEHAS